MPTTSGGSTKLQPEQIVELNLQNAMVRALEHIRLGNFTWAGSWLEIARTWATKLPPSRHNEEFGRIGEIERDALRAEEVVREKAKGASRVKT